MKQKRLGKRIAALLMLTVMGVATFHSPVFAQEANSAKPVNFANEKFRLWMIQALGIDTNHDGLLSQAELDGIEALVINDETSHWVPESNLSDFQNLADIRHLHSLKTLEIDMYDPNCLENGNRRPIEDIDFPDSLENLNMKNIYWEKADSADIKFTNLQSFQLYHMDLIVRNGDGTYSDLPTSIELTDTEGVLHSCIIEGSDVESIKLINNSNGKGIQSEDEKQRIRFSAPKCPNLESVEFLGEGYVVEGSLDLENDSELTHIGIPNDDKSKWTVYGEFDSTYAPVNVTLNGCTKIGSDCSEIIIDYNFINGRDINVQTMDTSFSDDHKLTILRQPRVESDSAGNVYLSCDNAGWVYTTYRAKSGFVVEDRTSFPTIAVFATGQRIRTDVGGHHDSASIYTSDTDRWVERSLLEKSIMEPSITERKWILKPGGHISSFGDLKFYTVDKSEDAAESLRRVFYKGDVYVEWEKQGTEDSIITLPTVIDETGGYKLTGTELKSTGIPGEVQITLYVYEKNSDGTFKKDDADHYVKSYIGYQDIKVYQMPTSVELLNDGTMRGSGTKDDPYIVDKNEELKLKARFLVNGDVDRSGDYVLRDIEWRIKAYNETPNDASDADGYSKYGSKLPITPEIRVVREGLNLEETEEQYDKRVDGIGKDGRYPEYFNHRRLLFDTDGLKFKIVAGLKNELNIYKEVFVEYHIFSSDCDSTCNGCGYERVAPKAHNFVNKECSACEIKECVATGNHDFSKYVSLGNGKHKVICEVCGATMPGHESDSCSGGAKCDKCGAELEPTPAPTPTPDSDPQPEKPSADSPFSDDFSPAMIEEQIVYPNTTADPSTLDCKFYHQNGKSYWYENGVRQGTYDDPKGVIGDGTIRGREICDMETAAWYWCDSVYNGAKAVNKEVWMPYIYQNEKSWSDDEIKQNAAASIDEHADMSAQLERDISAHTGKWVRYNANGKMFKGWYKVTSSEAQYYPDQVGNIYYYDPKTGLMAKGDLVIDGVSYHFDETSGVLQK